MKKLTLIILAAALATTAANADDYYFCYTGAGDRLYFATIPGPGSHSGLDVVHSIPIPTNSNALTYDGENWWIHNGNNDTVYCFDQNGDYVREFPAPGSYWLEGLGWDGQYLWVLPYADRIYQKDIYGNSGPYGSFQGPVEAVAIHDDKIISGDWRSGGSLPTSHLWVDDFNGNFLFWGAENGGYTECGWISLAYHDGIVWATSVINDSDYNYHYDIKGYYYDDDGDWDWYATIHDDGVQDLSICDADFINIAETSLGQIKVYFAEE